MSEHPITDGELERLRKLADAASPPPWRSMIEGRDHHAGDNFIMIGREDDRDEDLYLNCDSGPASAADHDFIAAARNLIVPLLDEIDRLRKELDSRLELIAPAPASADAAGEGADAAFGDEAVDDVEE